MSRIKRSLVTKLNLSILLMAVPIFLLTLGVLSLHTKHLIDKITQEQAFSVLNNAQQQMRNYMSTVETSIHANTWRIEENYDPDSLQAISEHIVRLNGNVSKVWFKFPSDTSSTEARWEEPNEAIATYSKPLRGKDGQIVSIICADLPFSHLAHTLNAIQHPYPEAFFMLLGGDGRFLIYPDSTRLFTKTIFTDTDPQKNADLIALGHEMTSGKKGSIGITLDGYQTFATYSPVPGTKWSLALVCPQKAVMRNYINLIHLVIGIIVIGLVIILLLSRRMVNHTIHPLKRLLVVLKKISEGNYDEFIKKTKRDDAVGQLQNSFAGMLQSLYFHMGIVRHSAEGARKRNEELVIATKQAEESVRQKTAFIQDVSHQVRTPLNIIMGFATVLRDSLVAARATNQNWLKEEETTKIANMMTYNANQLNRMVQMLYDSSEIANSEEERLQRDEIVSCNEIAHEAITYLNVRFPDKPINFQTAVDDDFSIHTNHLFLIRTLRELLYNAAKYSDGQHQSLTITKKDATVRFIVEDVGPGVPESERDSIFKPFMKFDSLAEGLGLGLPLSKRHAINLGGDLILDTDYHEGCRFILEVPIL